MSERLTLTAVPPVWTSAPLWSLTRRVSETGFDSLPLLSVYRELGVVPREGREDNYNRASEDLSKYQRVLPGDLVLNKMKTWQGSLGVSAHEGIVSPAYIVCRPYGAEVDGHYLHHLLRSRPYIAEYGARSKGIRPQQWDLPWDQLRQIPVLLPPLDEQRRIADFLDDQVARLDRAIALRQELVRLESSRAGVVADEQFGLNSGSMVRLGYLQLLLTSGPRGWGDFAGEVGVPFFRSANLDPSSLTPRLDNLTRVAPPASQRAEAARTIITTGDVLVGITGANTGWVTLVKESDGLSGAHVSQHVALIRANQRRLDSAWLAHFLRSPTAAANLLGSQYGGTKTQLSLPDLRDFRIPVPSLAEQARRLVPLREALQGAATLNGLSAQSISLLVERKQALIAAAVTGGVDVSTARGLA